MMKLEKVLSCLFVFASMRHKSISLQLSEFMTTKKATKFIMFVDLI